MPATLRSNSGNAEFAIELGARAEYAHDHGFESAIYLRGQHWDGDHTYPLSSVVEGLWLRSADIAALCDHISQWTGLPLDRLVVEELSRDFELARLPGQSTHIHFGPRSDTIS